MSWNYRVVKGVSLRSECTYLSIRTAWYDEGSETPHSIGDTSMYPMGENVDELTSDLTLMLQALGRPILNEEDFEMNPDFGSPGNNTGSENSK